MTRHNPTQSDTPIVPMRRQILEIKRRYPDTILLFRAGDAYEAFDDDAQLVADEFAMTPGERGMGKGVLVPVIRVSRHVLDGTIARLTAAGHKVAVCDQVSVPAEGQP